MGNFAQAAEALSSARYLVQESLTPRQHKLISRFHAGVIGTLRLVTFDTDSGPVVAGAFMRTAIGKATIDLWAGGGVLMPVDVEKCCLRESGVLKKGLKLVDTHPESGHRFGGAPVPYLAEAIAITCKLHGGLAVKSLGWDIALLEDGPCILEGNRHWDVFITAQLNLEFVHAFLRFHLPQGDQASARFVFSGSFDDRNAVRHWLCAVAGGALTSGRVEDCSRERIVMTIAGTKPNVESALRIARGNASRLKITDIAAAPCPDAVPPGLNLDATFAG
jgi:hypothetical protein